MFELQIFKIHLSFLKKKKRLSYYYGYIFNENLNTFTTAIIAKY